MQLKTTHEQFFTCLDYVNSVIPAARVDPILSHVLLRAENGEITMIGTNHEVQMKAVCKGELDGKLERIVPADKLRRVLSTFSGETIIKMEFSDDEVKIIAGRSTFKLRTKSTDLFTLLGETSEMQQLETMSCEDFLGAVNIVHYASAEESHRRSLNGMLLQRGDDGINFVGTDGHRMVVKNTGNACQDSSMHIVPIKTVHILAKHVGSEGEIQISANDRVIRFETDRFELISNIIQETYPDYQHVIPHSNNFKAVVEREAFKKSLDRVMALSDNNAVAYLEFDANKLSVNCNNTDNDSLVELIDIKYESEKLTLVVNAIYLTQFLNACKTQLIEISMSAPENSILIRPIEEEPSVNYVVMPVRT